VDLTTPTPQRAVEISPIRKSDESKKTNVTKVSVTETAVTLAPAMPLMPHPDPTPPAFPYDTTLTMTDSAFTTPIFNYSVSNPEEKTGPSFAKNAPSASAKIALP